MDNMKTIRRNARHALHSLRRLRTLRLGRDGMFVAVGVLALIGAFSMNPSTTNSSEAQFADTSAQGFSIVPASCPSDPHSIVECSVPPAPTGLRIACNAAGTSATLMYDPTPNATSYLFRVDRQDNPWTPRFCDGRLGDTQPGDICSAPLSVSSWSFPTTPDAPYGVWMHGVNSNGNGPGTGISFVCPSSGPHCANGLSLTLYPNCACPEGQVQVGDRCETPPRRPDDPFPPGQSSYPPVTTSYTTSYAPNSCWDGSDPNPISGGCPSCPPEYTRVGNSCVPTDSNPHFIGFPTTRGFNASGHLEVRPGLVRSGDVTYVYWNVSNVRDCTVRGTNGDGAPGSLTGTWNSLGSGAAGKTTSPITSRTDYTLFCRSLIGATPSTVTETRSVNVIPSWYEPKGEQ